MCDTEWYGYGLVARGAVELRRAFAYGWELLRAQDDDREPCAAICWSSEWWYARDDIRGVAVWPVIAALPV